MKLLVALILSASSIAAQAWGSEGHQVVALIAQSKLTSRAKAEVDRLLASEPGQTMASVSTWADEHRNPSTASWHYINFPRGNCSYDEQRDCLDGKCVVSAIKRQIEVLSSKGPDGERLKALKYLIHFVGDVHQPLHSGYLDDKGGNTYQLQAFMRGSNLHALWDKGLISNLDESPDSIASRLKSLTASASASDLEPAHAAEESCKIVSTPGFYPDRKIDAAYVQTYTPVVEQRLSLAGARLAGVLNSALK
jgi:nuclease S1